MRTRADRCDPASGRSPAQPRPARQSPPVPSRSCMRPRGARPREGWRRTSSIRGKAEQDVFYGDQPGDVRAYWIAQLSASAKQLSIPLRAADLELCHVLGIQTTPCKRRLDHASNPRGVKGNLLRARVIARGWKWAV